MGNHGGYVTVREDEATGLTIRRYHSVSLRYAVCSYGAILCDRLTADEASDLFDTARGARTNA